MNFFSFRDDRGFTMMEVLIAAGLLGALALAGSKLMVDQNKNMKTIEAKTELNSLLSEIRTILSDSPSCQATFQNRDSKNLAAGVVNNIFQNTPSGNVVRFEANPDWKLGKAYGNGNVRILSFALSDANTDPSIEVTPVAGVPVTGVTELIVTFSLGEKRVIGSDTLQRRIRMNVTTQTGTALIQTCSTAVSDNSLNDATLACTAINGVYDAPTERCNLSGYPGPVNAYTAVSTAYLDAWMADVLDSRYVNVTGDTMTGQLNFTGAAGIQLATGTINFASDRRLKKEIKDLPETLTKIRKIRPVSYKWKSTNKKHMGVIAQELAQVYPELVKQGKPGETMGVDYIQLVPILIKGVHELDEENKLLRESLQQTNKELRMLKKHLCKKNAVNGICESKR